MGTLCSSAQCFSLARAGMRVPKLSFRKDMSAIQPASTEDSGWKRRGNYNRHVVVTHFST